MILDISLAATILREALRLSCFSLQLFDIMSAADAAAPAAVANPKRGPNEFLKSIIGRPVQVKLNSGVVYKGAGQT